MSKKIRLSALCSVLLFTVTLFAQSDKNDQTGSITMTEAELSSFLGKIADVRRAQLEEEKSLQSQRYLQDLRSKYQSRSRLETNSSNSGYEDMILRELRYLNQRIDDLGYNGRGFTSPSRDNSTIIVPGSSNTSPIYPSNTRESTTIIPSNRKKIAELQSRIDSLISLKPIDTVGVEKDKFLDSLSVISGKFGDVRRQLDSLERKMVADGKLELTKDDTEDRSYFKQMVYFENNSEKLESTYDRYIENLVKILKEYPQSKILLEGWASPIGNNSYNKQLSMRRAESVESAFLGRGLTSDRILTAFRGEDSSSSEQQARRVDMAIILR